MGFPDQSVSPNTARLVAVLVVAALTFMAAIVGLAAMTPAAGSEDELEESAHDTPSYIAAPPLPATLPGAAFDPTESIASHDGQVIVTARVEDGRTRVEFGPGSSDPTWPTVTVELEGEAQLRAVSVEGDRAALSREIDTGSVVITIDRFRSDDGSGSVAELSFDRTVEPEAFSTDGATLYVIDHGSLPGSYRVRSVNLDTGELSDVDGPDKFPLEEEMNGRARRQVWGPDGTRLYTLYIRQTHHHHEPAVAASAHGHPEPGTDGFVHVLDLSEEWAFCLDLPEAFGKGELDHTALSVNSNKRELAVIDTQAGQAAFASLDELAITEVIDLPSELTMTDPATNGDTRGRIDGALLDEHLALVRDGTLHWLDRATLEALGDPVALGFTEVALFPMPPRAIQVLDMESLGDTIGYQPPS